jgi:hydrogenase maturation factor
MCMSRLHRVLRNEGTIAVEVEDLDGTVHRVSLLALDGETPAPGDWLVVHSGYAVDRVDRIDAEVFAAEVQRGAYLSRAQEQRS